MIENHAHFQYVGYVTHLDWVLYVFDEGVYAQRLPNAVKVNDPLLTGNDDNDSRRAMRKRLQERPLDIWLEGWHPTVGVQTFGNVLAEIALDRCSLSDTNGIDWYGHPSQLTYYANFSVFEDYLPLSDMVFVWRIMQAPSRIVIIPRPMLGPEDVCFDKAFNEAAAHAVLAKGSLAISGCWCEVRGAEDYVLKGYQIEVPGSAPNLFFDGGVLIQTHTENRLKGFHPWPDSFSAVLPDDKTVHDATLLLQDPQVNRSMMLKLLDLKRDDVPAGWCKVLIDKNDDGFRLTPLRGYVPFKLPSGKPNPAADASITAASVRLALAQARYAIEVDPRRVTRPPRFDFGSNWQIDELSAVAKAFYCNVMREPVPYGIGHDYLMPMVDAYIEDLPYTGIDDMRPQPSKKDLLAKYHADRSMREWLMLRITTQAMIKMLAKMGMKVLDETRLFNHPAPFKDGEFRNAIVVATDPVLKPSDAPSGVAKKALEKRQRTRPTFPAPFVGLLPWISSDADSPWPRIVPDKAHLPRTTFYYTPHGECLAPGSLGVTPGGIYRFRAHPKFDGEWGETHVYQL